MSKRKERTIHFMCRFIIAEAELTENDFANQFLQIRLEQDTFRSKPEYASKIGADTKFISKNRYRDIIPYDKNRVKLCSAPVVGVSSTTVEHASTPSNDADNMRYINASCIKVSPADAKYIAAQAPLPSTLDDWFDMIRENDVSVIVMLCKLVEGGRAKCERYWPEEVNNDKDYGQVVVTCLDEKNYDEFCHRKLKLKWKESGAKTNIEQLHFTEWPDHGCPQSEENILKMIELFDTMHYKQPQKPVLVHCSAGCGRTGTIIAANVVREIINNQKITKDIDLYELVIKLRKQRLSMVQTPDQYQFLHKLVKRFCCDKLKKWNVEIPAAAAASPINNDIHKCSGDQQNDNDTDSTADKTVKDHNNEIIARRGSHSPHRSPSRRKQHTTATEGSDNDGVTSISSEIIAIPDYPIEPDIRPSGPETMPNISSEEEMTSVLTG